jgi:hypothetical protein
MVAWRVLLLCRLGKEHPNLPASVLHAYPVGCQLSTLWRGLRGFSPMS